MKARFTLFLIITLLLNFCNEFRLNAEVDNFLSIKTNPFKYSGYYSDAESKLYYLKARYYSPKLMRFISRDTKELANRYTYAEGNPIMYSDQTGHDIFNEMGKIFSEVSEALNRDSVGWGLVGVAFIINVYALSAPSLGASVWVGYLTYFGAAISQGLATVERQNKNQTKSQIISDISIGLSLTSIGCGIAAIRASTSIKATETVLDSSSATATQAYGNLDTMVIANQGETSESSSIIGSETLPRPVETIPRIQSYPNLEKMDSYQLNLTRASSPYLSERNKIDQVLKIRASTPQPSLIKN